MLYLNIRNKSVLLDISVPEAEKVVKFLVDNKVVSSIDINIEPDNLVDNIKKYVVEEVAVPETLPEEEVEEESSSEQDYWVDYESSSEEEEETPPATPSITITEGTKWVPYGVWLNKLEAKVNPVPEEESSEESSEY